MWFVPFFLDSPLHLGLQEGLAQDMNLQPAQVYNWFANYRRRQKSRICREEKLNYLCPEGTLMHHAKDQQNRGSNTPQTAGLSLLLGMWPRKLKNNFKLLQEEKDILSAEAASIY